MATDTAADVAGESCSPWTRLHTRFTLLLMKPDLIGWIATGILVATIGRQTWMQWKSGKTAGVSKWLFIGQIAASVGFTIYSVMLDNWVFVVSNSFLLVIAIVGQFLFLRNRKNEKGRDGGLAAGGAALHGQPR
jgi:MtN3 and saliva related transmembrane protein